MGCFYSVIFLVGFVFLMVTFIRWFEQTAEAVDNGWWNKVMVLVVFPFGVWFFPSRVSAGRAVPVPHHEPVRGFGGLPKSQEPPAKTQAPPVAVEPPGMSRVSSDQPPPGTPKEFLELPKMTTAKPRAPIDQDKIAKLKQKMREQGMLPPEE